MPEPVTPHLIPENPSPLVQNVLMNRMRICVILFQSAMIGTHDTLSKHETVGCVILFSLSNMRAEREREMHGFGTQIIRQEADAPFFLATLSSRIS